MVLKPIRVVIADDHPVVRDGLHTVLQSSPDIEIVAVATSFADVLPLLSQIQVDVLVLDLGGMGGAPITFVGRIRRDFPEVAIVIFSSSVDVVPEMVHAGVRGYVVKEELSAQLVAAIHAACAHQTFLSPTAQEYMDRAMNGRKQYRLAPQEENVLKLLAQGLGTQAIAAQLAIDPRTVQNYIVSLRRKTGCDERTQLVTWYMRMYRHEEAA